MQFDCVTFIPILEYVKDVIYDLAPIASAGLLFK